MAELPAGPAEGLSTLLERERAALLAGDLGSLPAIVREKERLVELLETAREPPKPAAIERLRAQARTNQTLLEAALRGVRAAKDRLDVARGGGAALCTYDARGKAESHGGMRPSVERRA